MCILLPPLIIKAWIQQGRSSCLCLTADAAVDKLEMPDRKIIGICTLVRNIPVIKQTAL